jgi:hypothetical protein
MLITHRACIWGRITSPPLPPAALLEGLLDEKGYMRGHQRCNVRMVEINLQESRAGVLCKQWNNLEMMDVE